jgi:hypothetical protein
MSWATCNSGSNNIHFNFPPIMNDGRNFAKWQPGAVINQEIRKENNIQSNSQYRQFLVENADSIISSNQQDACDNCGYCSCIVSGESISNTPFLYSSCMDNSQPYGYENSDLKSLYLSSYQLQSRMVSPLITQDELLRQNLPNPN